MAPWLEWNHHWVSESDACFCSTSVRRLPGGLEPLCSEHGEAHEVPGAGPPSRLRSLPCTSPLSITVGPSTPSFIRAFIQRIWCTHCVPGAGPGPGDTAVNKTDIPLAFQMFLSQRQGGKKQAGRRGGGHSHLPLHLAICKSRRSFASECSFASLGSFAYQGPGPSKASF